MLTLPYVQVNEFRAYPSFMDTLNLRQGDTTQADQDQELRQMLLLASSMADDFMEFGQNSVTDGVLQAHQRTESRRMRASRRDGSFHVHPDHKPILGVSAFSYGADPKSLQQVTDLSGVWVERASMFVMPLGGFGPGFTQIQFGTPLYDAEYFVQYTYTAGYVNTLLASTVGAGASTVPVMDATGISGGSLTQPATVLRFWDPGSEEAVTVASSYVPGSLNVPITTPLVNNHVFSPATPIGISSLPPHAHEAVILYACALLMRPDTEAEDVFPGARRSPNTNVGDKSGGQGYVEEAERLLDGLRRIR